MPNLSITDIFNSKAIALRQTEVASNRKPFIGEGFFPAEKKLGLNLKNIRTHKGLGVSLAPSNFDADPTLRGRQGFSVNETQMAFFREAMLVKEEDEQLMMTVQEAGDAYSTEVLRSIYNDVDPLVEGARIVAERMRMQLLAPTVDGSPRIYIEHNGVEYSYNYDPDGSYKTNNYMALSTSADKWTDTTNSDPISDVNTALDIVEGNSGTRPSVMLISKATMGYLAKNEKIKGIVLSQNVTANVYMTDDRVKDVFRAVLGVDIVVYTKQYKDETGTAQKFYPDGYVTLLPSTPVGKTWYGTTPEERTAMGNPAVDVSIVDTGIAVAVGQTRTTPPWQTQTTVSEVLLPSYEGMDETYVIKVY